MLLKKLEKGSVHTTCFRKLHFVISFLFFFSYLFSTCSVTSFCNEDMMGKNSLEVFHFGLKYLLDMLFFFHFSNATLQEISRKMPKTKEELLEISGIGR